MVRNNMLIDYNSRNLARRDPFTLEDLYETGNVDKIQRYNGLISCFLQKMLESTTGFSGVELKNLGTFGKASYYFRLNDQPEVIHYSAFDESERFRKGDNQVIVNSSLDLFDKIKNYFEIIKSLEVNNWKTIDIDHKDYQASLDVKSDMYDLRFFVPEDIPQFFIFKYHNMSRKKTIVKGLDI